MINTASTLADGSPLVTLALSDENWLRLRAGEPITVRLHDLHPDLPSLTVCVVGGPDEPSLRNDLTALGWSRPPGAPAPRTASIAKV